MVRKIDSSSSERWLLSSNLQKAIRRGHINLALNSAEKLEKIHPEYVRRRLRVIGLEDIGIAAPELVAGYLEQSVDCNRSLLLDTVAAFTDAPKDRNAAEILNAAATHPWFQSDRDYVATATIEQLAETVHQANNSLYRRALAGWALAGTSRVPSTHLATGKRDFNFFLKSLAPLHLPLSLLTLCKLGTNAKDYGLGLGCVLAWLYAAPHLSKPQPESLFNDVKRGKLLLPSVDSHTRPGLAAIKEFAETCVPLREFLTAELGKGIKAHMRYIATALFEIEGANVSKRLHYSGWERPFIRATEGRLCRNRFGLAQLAILRGLIKGNITSLNHARLKTL